MHVSLTPELENQVKRRVASGLYHTASEVVRESLRLMMERDAIRDRLNAEIQLGYEELMRGEGVSVTSEANFRTLVRAGR